MPLPGAYDLNLYRGDTYQWRFRLWSDAARTVPVDLTGASAKSEIRDRPAGTVVVAMGTQITLPNIVDVTLGATMWPAMPRSGVWDLQVSMSGKVHTPVAGKVTTCADVTDSIPAPATRRAR